MELKIEHLSKQFKDKTAVNDVNLTLTPGVWGLLGANGAGKTTLMRMSVVFPAPFAPKSPQTPGVNVRLTSFTAVLSLNCLLKCSIFSSMLTLLSFASAEQ